MWWSVFFNDVRCSLFAVTSDDGLNPHLRSIRWPILRGVDSMQANPFLAPGIRSVGFSIEFSLPELSDSSFRFAFALVISGYNSRQILHGVGGFRDFNLYHRYWRHRIIRAAFARFSYRLIVSTTVGWFYVARYGQSFGSQWSGVAYAWLQRCQCRTINPIATVSGEY